MVMVQILTDINGEVKTFDLRMVWYAAQSLKGMARILREIANPSLPV